MNINDINIIQQRLKIDIKKEIAKGGIQRAIDLIDCYADVTQRINNILRDEDIECFLKTIACRINNGDDIKEGGLRDVILLYDQIGTTTCLGLQYLRGLAANGYKIVYIYEGRDTISKYLLEEVKETCFHYHLFDTNRVFKNGRFMGDIIREVIINEKPSRIIVHPQATGALGMATLFSIEGCLKYRIVPGDHHFYIGYDCFNYFIEFRPFGWSTAVFERNISKDKIYSLNYYPIITEFVDFEGFPPETQGKVIMCSGGSTYKFMGSGIFYELLENILCRTNNTVFLFLGTPSEQLVALSKKENMRGRIFFLGYRKDFVPIMKNIDILINSIPFSGGLFCQTAAFFAKPILSYSENNVYEDNAVADILGSAGRKGSITFTSKEGFLSHAIRLIEDEEYRKENGDFAKSILQTEGGFNSSLGSILKGYYPTLASVDVEYVERTPRINSYIYIRNEGEPDYLMPLARTLGIGVFKYTFSIPNCVLHNLKYLFHHILASYMKKIEMRKKNK